MPLCCAEMRILASNEEWVEQEQEGGGGIVRTEKFTAHCDSGDLCIMQPFDWGLSDYLALQCSQRMRERKENEAKKVKQTEVKKDNHGRRVSLSKKDEAIKQKRKNISKREQRSADRYRAERETDRQREEDRETDRGTEDNSKSQFSRNSDLATIRKFQGNHCPLILLENDRRFGQQTKQNKTK